MRFQLLAAYALVLAAGFNSVANAGAQELVSAPAELSIPNSRQIKFESAINGREYLISVAVPLVPPPEDGYPVLYLLDPHWAFGTAVDAARLNAPDTMIVGIGYPLEDAKFVAESAQKMDGAPAEILAQWSPRGRAIYALRIHDLSLPFPAERWPIGGRPALADISSDLSGGLDSFLEMIEMEVKPHVSLIAPVDSGKEALFGYSAGGLAVLHALFTRPNSYDSFIAASPAIWISPELWEEQKKFSERVTAGNTVPRILLMAGSKEQEGMGAAAKMVDNMREMAMRLRMNQAEKGLISVQDVVFADEDHGSVLQPSVGRGILFAFRSPQ